MANFRMSLGNAIFMALTFISYCAGITGAVDSYVEQAACSFADVAQTRQFDLEIRLSHPEWYSEGMQIFPYGVRPSYWKKRHLTWAILNKSKYLTQESVTKVMRKSFQKWSKATDSVFTFSEAKSNETPDIRIKFVPEIPWFYESMTIDPKKKMDDDGVDIEFVDLDVWTNMLTEHKRGFNNFEFAALYEVGHALGMGESKKPTAIMYSHEGENPASKNLDEPELTMDDVCGIRDKYQIPRPKSANELY